ncbi:5-(carboxyamino)imidazole ribonucleotide mutase [Candidatus Micrarchaeota archaeon CG1_02_47_40]|nr:MAG: 5-(carboxyamino)imidazole ribonucleotide mutase [Candidatus Micrarchaeota archaeon CG1_02_47_40]
MQKVQIILGSSSDEKIAQDCQKVLQAFGVECKTDIASAHRNPEKLEGIVQNSSASVFIAIAGLSAALPGAIASHTIKPVIGVPVNVKLDGLDALLSVMQLPSGIPVAAVGIDNGKNAALLAVEILALSDAKLANKLADYRAKMKR